MRSGRIPLSSGAKNSGIGSRIFVSHLREQASEARGQVAEKLRKR
jgi:hypothetical protein